MAADRNANERFLSQTIWAGTSIHELVPGADAFRMRSKKVVLLNNAEPLPNVLFLS